MSYDTKDGLKALEIVFKRFVFGLLSVFLTTGPRKAAGKQTPDFQKRKRILFLRFDKLGDMIVSLSVFETLAQVAPQLEVEVLASPANCGIIAHDSRVKKIWLYSKRPWRDWKTLRVLRDRNYSAVVDMVCLDSVTSLFLSQYIGRRVERVGIGKKRFAKYYTGNVTLNESNYEHIIESSLRVLTHLGIPEEQFVHQAPLKLPEQAVDDAESFVSSLKQGESQALVVGVNISAGKPNRIWQENNYVALLDLLHESKTKLIIIILCAPNDREVALRICKGAGERVSLVPDGLNILQVSAIIARCDILRWYILRANMKFR